jgi:hypothetical protein
MRLATSVVGSKAENLNASERFLLCHSERTLHDAVGISGPRPISDIGAVEGTSAYQGNAPMTRNSAHAVEFVRDGG